MEDTGGEDGVCFAFLEDIDHVVEVTRAAAGDDGYADGGGDGGGELDVVAGLGAVGVHAGEEDFSRAAVPGLDGPGDGIFLGGAASAVGVDSPLVGLFAFGVDGDDDALAAEDACAFVDEVWGGEGGGVDADFVCACVEHFVHVVDGANAAADGEWDEAVCSGAADDVDHGAAVVGRGGDVEKNEFVGLLIVVGDGAFDGIAGVDEVDEVDAFDDAA